MSGGNKHLSGDKPSALHRSSRVEGASFEFSYSVHEEYAPTCSKSNIHSSTEGECKLPEILSTAKLINAVGQIWDRANNLAVSQPTKILNNDGSSFQKKVTFGNQGGNLPGREYTSGDGEYLFVDSRTAGKFAPIAQPTFEFLNVKQKMGLDESCSKIYAQPLFLRFLQGDKLSEETLEENRVGRTGISYDLGKVYSWMKEMNIVGLKNLVSVLDNNNKKESEYCSLGDGFSIAARDTEDIKTNPKLNVIVERTEEFADLAVSKEAYSCATPKVAPSAKAPQALSTDYRSNVVASLEIIEKECKLEAYKEGELLEKITQQPEKFVTQYKDVIEINAFACGRPPIVPAKKGHAFAGALAGVFVSLCLHPIDTVKTVIQACRADQKSISYIGKSIVTERGMMGLYRGIASNLAFSAPISAIYTFTYESAKGALLPFFPKEYSSVAHCTAGGCASVATSFIFTPSERVKQQMQIGSRYNNSWNAMVGIIREGGLPSLYAGWGAVLCRNVPHSIIKFYTYESLKQFLTSQSSNPQPSTQQTLVCGGIAGITASLFTTPFDVVKTRLQTQVPGSTSKYGNCFHALQEIRKGEGLKGLYRGLIPRVVMYMSQGALFFASYEFLKILFYLETEQPNDKKD